MIRKSITLRLFIMNLFSTITLLLIVFLLQQYLFTNYYYDYKIKTLTENFDSFAKEFQNKKWSTDDYYKQIQKFNSSNNATLSISSSNSTYETTSSEKDFVITVKQADGSTVPVLIDPQFKKDTLKDNLPKMNSPITVKGYYEDSFGTKYLVPISMTFNGKTYVMEDAANMAFRGTLIESPVAAPSTTNAHANSTDWCADSSTENVNLFDQPITIIGTMISNHNTNVDGTYAISNTATSDADALQVYSDPYSNVNYVTMSQVITSNNDTYTLQLDATLQPINEALNLFSRYIILFFAVSIVIALLFTYSFSMRFTKPIVTINKKAKQMANMDFDVQLPVTSSDELGLLSESINTMSSQLKKTLDDLNTANDELQKDIDYRIKQEEVRKELVANVSHDLKTPLGIIKTHAEALKDGIRKEKSDYYTDVILDEISIMDALLKDMIKLSKIEASALLLNPQQISLRALLDEVLCFFEPLMEDKELALKITGLDYDVVVDEKMMIQVFSNLLSNVIDYGEEGSDLTLDLDAIAKRLTISNQGPKIDEDKLDKIWDRFYKLDPSRNRVLGGSGIGLAIVKSILDQHHFQYGVYNHKTGVSFWIDFSSSKEES